MPARKGPDESTYAGRCAARLRMLRERAGLSVEDVASLCDVSYAAVYRWERGQSDPPLATLPILATAYGLKSVCRVLAED